MKTLITLCVGFALSWCAVPVSAEARPHDEGTCFSRPEFNALREPMTRARLERVTETVGLAVPDPHPTTLEDGGEVDNWFYPDCRFHGRLLVQVTYVDDMWDVVVYPSRAAVRLGYAVEA